MRDNNQILHPPFSARIWSVWFRHFRVYSKNLLSNGMPPFLEPLIFLAGIGIGMERYVAEMNGIPYLTFLATGLPLTAAMYTAAFECSYGTFIRLEYEKIYDGMLAAPLLVEDILVGEIVWAGTKGFFFSFAVILVMAVFGIVPLFAVVITPFIGFLTGILFASLSMLITTFVASINHFNFYFTGFLSPMFFFSGVVFPIENLPEPIRYLAEALPLTHGVRMVRQMVIFGYSPILLWDLFFMIVFTSIVAVFGVGRLKTRLVS
ncbi:ABC-type multidrug transport system, permease component [Chitinispirillum alkaliphilum]|nr:ABC-type multidrug transport system, permease component [Chitinispirillum alkaliphilum]